MVYIVPRGSYHRLTAVFAIPHLMFGIFSLIPIIITGVMMGGVVITAVILAAWILITGIVGVAGAMCAPQALPTQNTGFGQFPQLTETDTGLNYLKIFVGFNVIAAFLALGSIIHGAVVLAGNVFFGAAGGVAISFGFFFLFLEIVTIVRAVAVIKAAGVAASGVMAPGMPGQPVIVGGYHPSSTNGQAMQAPNSTDTGANLYFSSNNTYPQNAGFSNLNYGSGNASSAPGGAPPAYADAVKY